MAKKAAPPEDDLGNHTHNEPPPPLTAEDRADLLATQLQQHRSIDKSLDELAEKMRGIRKTRQRLRNEIKADGHPLKYIDEQLRDEQKARHEQEDDAKARTFIRRVGHLPVTGEPDQDQLDLFGVKTSKGDVSLVEDDARWAGIALAVALRGGDPDPATNNVPPERLQAWEQGITMGFEQIGKSMARAAEINKRREAEA